MNKNLILGFITILSMNVAAKNYSFIVGTFTNGTKSEGIYGFSFDSKTKKADVKLLADKLENPAFLAFSPDSNFVYAVNEADESSKVCAFRFDKNVPALIKLNDVTAGGSGPCNIDVSEKHVVTANYKGGSLVVFRRNNDGTITDPLQIINHTGRSLNTARQTKPYVHQSIFTPDYQYLFTNDLGTDYVNAYKYYPDSDKNILIPTDSILVKPGSGPRHLTFNKEGNIAYLVQELLGMVSVIDFNNGKLNLLQEMVLGRKKELTNAAADIHLSPDENFLYVTNRGSENNITCFRVMKNHKLLFIQQIPTEAEWPRNFAISNDGKYVFIGNQYSDKITVFKRSLKTGKLKYTGFSINIPAPVCLLEY